MKGMKFFRLTLITAVLLSATLFAQEEKVEWKHTETTTETELHLFRSTQSVNLPTAEMLQKGDWKFEISHRFLPNIKTGIKTFYGLDGPVNMRLALGYAILNNLMITLGRSNVNDNVDLWLKYKALQIPNDLIPLVVSLRLGTGWNTEVPNRESGNSRNYQYYGQLILNTLISKRLGIGIVPSYLNNSDFLTNETQNSFTLGTNVQIYFSRLFAVLFEWNPTLAGFRTFANPVAFGIELNTGGHFFKIILTNSTYLNPSQFLAGADESTNSGNWKIGFNITRLLKF